MLKTRLFSLPAVSVLLISTACTHKAPDTSAHDAPALQTSALAAREPAPMPTQSSKPREAAKKSKTTASKKQKTTSAKATAKTARSFSRPKFSDKNIDGLTVPASTIQKTAQIENKSPENLPANSTEKTQAAPKATPTPKEPVPVADINHPHTWKMGAQNRWGLSLGGPDPENYRPLENGPVHMGHLIDRIDTSENSSFHTNVPDAWITLTYSL